MSIIQDQFMSKTRNYNAKKATITQTLSYKGTK